MISNTELKHKAMQVLVKHIGLVETEQFISLIQRESFDYTQWQKQLWQDKGLADLSKEAMDYRIKR